MNTEEYQQQMDAYYLNQQIAEEFYYDIVTTDVSMPDDFKIWHDLPAAAKNQLCKLVDELRNCIRNNCME